MTQAHTRMGIVWLASYPRSGNTWTRNFLHNLFAVLDGRQSTPHDINALSEFTIWEIAGTRFEKVLGKRLSEATREEIAAARAKVQQHIADEASGPVFVKTHNALVHDRGYPIINTNVTSGAVYIVRNPLDVVISFAHHFAIDIETAIARMGQRGLETDLNAQVVHEVHDSWTENVLSWTRTPHRAIHVMRYEDMLGKPLETFRSLTDHLLIDCSEAQIAQAIELSSFEEARAQEEKGGYRERPQQSTAFFREGRAGQWRERLSNAQVIRLVAQHREQMSRFSYVPEGF